MATKKNMFGAAQAARGKEQATIKESNGIKEQEKSAKAEKKDKAADKKETAYSSVITLSIMPEDHTKLKILAATTGKKMNVLLHEMINAYKA